MLQMPGEYRSNATVIKRCQLASLPYPVQEFLLNKHLNRAEYIETANELFYKENHIRVNAVFIFDFVNDFPVFYNVCCIFLSERTWYVSGYLYSCITFRRHFQCYQVFPINISRTLKICDLKYNHEIDIYEINNMNLIRLRYFVAQYVFTIRYLEFAKNEFI